MPSYHNFSILVLQLLGVTSRMSKALSLLLLLLLPEVSGKLGGPSVYDDIADNYVPTTNATTSVIMGKQIEQRILKQVKLIGGSGNPPASALPLQECEGDCDSDAECDDGLVCFQKDAYTRVPGCVGGENDRSKSDYCVRREYVSGNPQPTGSPPAKPPSSEPEVEAVGNNGRPSGAFPLKLCQGDCDRDSDCEGNLVCFQRGPYQAVRGCSGGDIDDSDFDYCVRPSGQEKPDETNPSATGTFRLKLYWEPGYYWQEETVERKWCVEYRYKGLPGDGRCWYGLERRSCNDDQVYISRCNNDSNQKFQFLKLSNGEVQIKVAGKNECFQRYGREIYLRSCDSGEQHQRWYAPNGDFEGSRFEVSQRSLPSQCMTQDHHPKPGEVVEMHSCQGTRSKNSETSFWNRY